MTVGVVMVIGESTAKPCFNSKCVKVQHFENIIMYVLLTHL